MSLSSPAEAEHADWATLQRLYHTTPDLAPAPRAP